MFFFEKKNQKKNEKKQTPIHTKSYLHWQCEHFQHIKRKSDYTSGNLFF